MTAPTLPPEHRKPSELDLMAAGTLDNGADYIERHGHRAGRNSQYGPVDILTSILDEPGESHAKDTLNEWLGGDFDDWERWTGRTKEDVVETMRAIAADLRGEPISLTANGVLVRQHVLEARMADQRQEPDESDYLLSEEQIDELARFDAAGWSE